MSCTVAAAYVWRLPMLRKNAEAEDPYRHDDEPGLIDTWFSVVKRSGRQLGQDFRFRIESATTRDDEQIPIVLCEDALPDSLPSQERCNGRTGPIEGNEGVRPGGEVN